MKNILFLISIFTITSCSVSNYYQVYTTVADGNKSKNDNILFEDNNCIVSYNLWEEGGNIGFKLLNKTSADLTIDLTRSFFVMNGVANSYFQGRTFSNSTSNSSTISTSYYPTSPYWSVNKVAGTSTNSYATSFTEQPVKIIPAGTSIIISNFLISNERYLNCDLPVFPYSAKRVKTLPFNKANSPFVFSNILTYVANGDTNRTENKFFVSEITNYPEKEVVFSTYKSPCGTPLSHSRKVFKKPSPEKFYIHYSSK